MAEDTLPQMPEPEALGMDFDNGWDGVRAYGYTADQLRAYAAQAVAQERERAARICDDQSDRARTSPGASRADNCARRIRAGSPSPQPAPGMAVQALAAEIVKALLADEKDGGYDLTAGLFGPNFSGLVRRWAALEYAAPQPPSAWRPIEEAPRDGSMFLGWVSAVRYGEDDEGRQYEQDVSQVDFCQWRDCFDGIGGYIDVMAGDIGDAQRVTHWQPLPPPPSAGEEKTA